MRAPKQFVVVNYCTVYRRIGNTPVQYGFVLEVRNRGDIRCGGRIVSGFNEQRNVRQMPADSGCDMDGFKIGMLTVAIFPLLGLLLMIYMKKHFNKAPSNKTL